MDFNGICLKRFDLDFEFAIAVRDNQIALFVPVMVIIFAKRRSLPMPDQDVSQLCFGKVAKYHSAKAWVIFNYLREELD